MTRIAEAQDALATILEARQALAGVPVDVGWPAPSPEPEHIWVRGTVADWRSARNTTDPDRDERFTLVVRVIVIQSTENYREVRTRLLALVAEIEQAVDANPNLNDAVWDSELQGGAIDEILDQDGRGLDCELRIACRAFLA